MAELGAARLHHLTVMVADGEKLMERDHDHAVRKCATDRVDGFQTEADKMMEVNHIRLQVSQDAKEIALQFIGVVIRNQKMIVLVRMIEECRRSF